MVNNNSPRNKNEQLGGSDGDSTAKERSEVKQMEKEMEQINGCEERKGMFGTGLKKSDREKFVVA